MLKERNILPLDVYSWKLICERRINSQQEKWKSDLQRYPYLLLDYDDINKIISEEFFLKHIHNGNFMSIKPFMHKQEGFHTNWNMQPIESFLVSPLTILVLEAISIYLFNNYKFQPSNNIIYFFSDIIGDFIYDLDKAKKTNIKIGNKWNDYIEKQAQKYKYFIHLDIKKCMYNTKTGHLSNLILKYSSKNNNQINSQSITNFAQLLEFVGPNGYPIFKDNVVTWLMYSYIYFNETDEMINEFMCQKRNQVNFKMYRFMDDLYIFFNTDKNFQEISKSVITYSQDIYNAINMKLNMNKTSWGKCSKLITDLQTIRKKSKTNKENKIQKIYTKFFLNKTDKNLIFINIANIFTQQMKNKDKTGKFNKFDAYKIIRYLIIHNYRNQELIQILKKHDKNTYNYYTLFCKQSFMKHFRHD